MNRCALLSALLLLAASCKRHEPPHDRNEPQPPAVDPVDRANQELQPPGHFARCVPGCLISSSDGGCFGAGVYPVSDFNAGGRIGPSYSICGGARMVLDSEGNATVSAVRTQQWEPTP